MNLFSASVSSSVLRRYKINNNSEFTAGTPTHRGRDTPAGIRSSSYEPVGSKASLFLDFHFFGIHAVQFEAGSLPVKGFFSSAMDLLSLLENQLF